MFFSYVIDLRRLIFLHWYKAPIGALITSSGKPAQLLNNYLQDNWWTRHAIFTLFFILFTRLVPKNMLVGMLLHTNNVTVHEQLHNPQPNHFSPALSSAMTVATQSTHKGRNSSLSCHNFKQLHIINMNNDIVFIKIKINLVAWFLS